MLLRKLSTHFRIKGWKNVSSPWLVISGRYIYACRNQLLTTYYSTNYSPY